MKVSGILSNLKKCRQHLIYAVICIVLAQLAISGIYFTLPFLIFFIFKFPGKWWIFYIIFLLSFGLIILNGRSTTTLTVDDTSQFYTVYVSQVRRQSNDRQTATAKIGNDLVFLTLRSEEPLLLPGMTLEVFGRLSQPTHPTVPYRFDFKSFLYSQNIEFTLHTSEAQVVSQQFSIWQIQHHLANWVQHRFPNPTASYIQALFLGRRDDMDEETLNMYSQLGIMHIFAISGAHVTLLAGLVEGLFKRIGLMDVMVDGLVMIFCLLFIVVAGCSISIIRASLMFCVTTLNKRLKWQLSAFDVFAVVFLSCFLFNPRLLLQLGFQYSFWISFILMISKPALSTLDPIVANVSAVYLAWMAAIPITIATNFELNIAAFVANLLLVPLLMTFIFPLLLMTIFLPFISHLTNPMLSLFELINQMAHPWLNQQVNYGHLTLSVVILLLIFLVYSLWRYEVSGKKWIRGALMVGFIVILEINRLWQPASIVTFLDVGQGDATILHSPFQSCTIVVDTGGDLGRINSDQSSIFSNTLEPYLLGSGIRKIDFLILTHEHYDHIAEAIPLMERFKVGAILYNGAPVGNQMQAIKDTALEFNIPLFVPAPGDVFSCGNQSYTFIHREVDGTDPNEDSLVMAVDINGWKVLLTGDIGHPTEEVVLKQYPYSVVDIYHVAHHGSAFSNSLNFMASLNIRYAVVSVGRRNFYGHPSQLFLDDIDYLEIPLLNNAVHGTVSFRLFGGRYEILIWPYEQ